MVCIGVKTSTTITQLAVCGDGSLFNHVIVTVKRPEGVVLPTVSVALAIPPTPGAGANSIKVIVPGLLGVMFVIAAPVIVPSASLALTEVLAVSPVEALRFPRQLGTTGALTTTTTDMVQFAV